MRDVAPCFEEAVDRDALIEMFAVVPAVEIGFVLRIDVHRRQQHAFSGKRHISTSLLGDFGSEVRNRPHHGIPDAGIVERMAGALDQANFELGQTAASACEVDGGHSKS